MSATFPLFSLDKPNQLKHWLKEAGWVVEPVTGLAPAGEGNMNLVVRVQTAEDSVIFKQSRPFVQKYPSIAAPADRLLTEAEFYRATSVHESVATAMPRLLRLDRAVRAALFEDLGEASDCTDLYAGAALDVTPLVKWLEELHSAGFDAETQEGLRNREMRALNHAHIFDLPMSGAHGMDLDDVTPGLQEVARRFRAAGDVQRAVGQLGEVYLADGPTLLHGDFYPGSWLRTGDGIRVIDPEFAFFGPAEFDLGVLRAHLIMAGMGTPAVDAAMEAYASPRDRALESRFAGVEIMRRLIGVAQLPLQRSLEQKEALLSRAAELLRS